MSAQSRVLSAWTGRKSRGDTGACNQTGGAGSPDGGRGVHWTTGDTMHDTKLAGAFSPVDRNRPMPNGTYGGVGGRRGRPRLLPDPRQAAMSFAEEPRR
jgi:hypothetical protein